MINNCIVIRIEGDVVEQAENIVTTDWARYTENNNYTTIKIPAQKDFLKTAEEVYSQIGIITDIEYIKEL